MKILFILVCCTLSLTAKSQINSNDSIINSCDSIKKLGYGTFKAIVRYWDITEDDYDDYTDKTYQKIKKKYNADNLIQCSSANCWGRSGCGCIFLLSYKNKYKYTLYHNKNKDGKYEQWEQGKLIKITFVRLNHFCQPPAGSTGFDSPWLVSVITDIEPL